MDGLIFSFYIGDTYEKTIVVSKYQDEIDEMYFTIKNNDSDKNYLLQKTLNNGLTIVEDKTEEGVRIRTYDLFIDANDTEGFKVGKEYPFDVEIVTDKEETKLKRTILKGVVVLNDATTRRWNEVV